MPRVNLYNIVTNDAYEMPIACDIKGRQAAADFLKLGLTQFYRNLKSDRWNGKYKAVFIGVCPIDDDFLPNANILPLSNEDRMEIAKTKRQERIEKARRKKVLESREYYRQNRIELLKKAKERNRKKAAVIGTKEECDG